MTIITIIIVCAVTAYWLLKHKAKDSLKATQRPGNIHHIYQAASIKPGDCACSAVKPLGDKRFLSSEAPPLPLLNCDSEKCQCRFVRHEDRRQREDRRAAYCLQTDLHTVAGKEEHRGKTCRRSADKLTGAASDLRYDDIEWAT